MPRLVTARHEAAAANMAEAAGKLTGRAAVCFVTRGPGATHASIALHTAYQDGTPLLLVVGQVTRAHLGRQAFQEMDYAGVFGSSAKAVTEVLDADHIPEHVARAVEVAHTGRPGPVVLVIPEDVLAETTTSRPARTSFPDDPPLPVQDLRELAGRLAIARHPVLIVGGPGWTADVGEDVRRFAERSSVPVVAAFRWQDAVDNRSPAYVGWLGLGCSPRLRERVAEADLVVALGPRLDDPTTDGFALVDRRDPASVVLVSQDPGGLTQTGAAGHHIRAGLAGAAAYLAGEHGSPRSPSSEWCAALRCEYEAFRIGPADRPEPDLVRIVQHVRSALPDDAVVTNGAGNYAIWLQRYFEFRQFPTQLAPRNGAMGYGLPAGARRGSARPDPHGGDVRGGRRPADERQRAGHRRAVRAEGHRHRREQRHVRHDPDAPGAHYPGRVVATQLRNPDFVAYARSFGVSGAVVRRTEDFPPAFAEALAHDGPALIEVRTDPAQLTPDLRLETSP